MSSMEDIKTKMPSGDGLQETAPAFYLAGKKTSGSSEYTKPRVSQICHLDSNAKVKNSATSPVSSCFLLFKQQVTVILQHYGCEVQYKIMLVGSQRKMASQEGMIHLSKTIFSE